MKKIGFMTLLLAFMVSCSQSENNNKKVSSSISSIEENKDSLLVDTLIKQQKFILANAKIDSVILSKPLNQKGYYYLQKGFSCLMLGHHKEAVSNFELAISLGYKVEESKAMIVTAKKMKETYDQYN
ncbi:hypothetical protein DHW03_05625 [Pedobacter yonginense]|uniref:Tetratricopeptide repeat protein n=1 Tax=Pedobacter yonginense TaxID=651869 RepID=A0A317EVP6_9SPHI|nr:hypothetical protein [Pedobacter yonginense]PWS29296.1 hypothetical protein DHW03_05625 [Pedobacter yonginense]